MLKKFYNEDSEIIEVGIDEAGRGPMFGRVYAAAVILPKDDSFDHSLMKDSKRFHSHKKITEVYEYIKKNALDYRVCFADENTIDEINIRQATLNTMTQCVKTLNIKPNFLLVDGNDYPPYLTLSKDGEWEETPHVCIKGGDNAYTSIAAASILAKVERDNYIEKLCDEHPELDEHYNIRKNKGYGTKHHMEGIKKYGLTKWHRKTFGICRSSSVKK